MITLYKGVYQFRSNGHSINGFSEQLFTLRNKRLRFFIKQCPV